MGEQNTICLKRNSQLSHDMPAEVSHLTLVKRPQIFPVRREKNSKGTSMSLLGTSIGRYWSSWPPTIPPFCWPSMSPSEEGPGQENQHPTDHPLIAFNESTFFAHTIRSFKNLSIYLSFFLSFYLSIYLSFLSLYIYIYIYLFKYIYIYIYIFIYIYIYLFIYIYIYIYLSTCECVLYTII